MAQLLVCQHSDAHLAKSKPRRIFWCLYLQNYPPLCFLLRSYLEISSLSAGEIGWYSNWVLALCLCRASKSDHIVFQVKH